MPPDISKKSSAYLIDIYVLFDQMGDVEFKNGVKIGTGSSFRRHFGEKPNFRVSVPCISVICLCSATTRSADRSVDWRRFGAPLWTGNRTATHRRTDSDHAECISKYKSPTRGLMAIAASVHGLLGPTCNHNHKLLALASAEIKRSGFLSLIHI